MKDLSRNVTMLCPICGNDQFESDYDEMDLENNPDEVTYKCSDCGTVFSREELIEENRLKVNLAIDEIKDEAVKEIEKELKKVLKKWK